MPVFPLKYKNMIWKQESLKACFIIYRTYKTRGVRGVREVRGVRGVRDSREIE